MAHYQLDARKLLCPMPVIKTQNKIKTLESGDTLDVICTDPGALEDIPAFCRIHGHHVTGVKEMGSKIIICITVCVRS